MGRLSLGLLTAALALTTLTAHPQAPPASADPYANNPWTRARCSSPSPHPPVRTPAQSPKLPPEPSIRARSIPPNGSTAPHTHVPDGTKFWNPVMLKMMKGEKVTGGTVSTPTPLETYCAMANAGYDFIWTEMQHNQRDWDAVGRMWKACPHAKAVPGVRVAYSDEREIQHAIDLGALVIVIPTVRSVEEGTAARDWTMYPSPRQAQPGRRPGLRSRRLGQCPRRLSQHHQQQHRPHRDDRDPRRRRGCPRNCRNPRRHRHLRRQRRPRQLLRLQAWARPTTNASSTSCTMLPSLRANGSAVHSHGAIAPTSPVFQAGSETVAIGRGVAAELGPLKDTQGKPAAGPYAPKK